MEQEHPASSRNSPGASKRPSVLWIGCSDSRVPTNEIIALPIRAGCSSTCTANVVVHSDH